MGIYAKLIIWLSYFSLLLLAGCSGQEEQADDGKLKIVCTTGMIGDALQNIVGDKAEVISLMGPGVDPHLYKATQGDLNALTSADVIFYNGLHLEGKMGEVLEKLGRQKKVVALAEALPSDKLINTTNYAGAYDPHIWFDVALWSEAVAYAAEKMYTLDTMHAEQYQSNTEAYLQQLDSLHTEVKSQIAAIPAERRVLITAHDAFTYFGEAYEIEVRGLQGISTISEYGLRDISDLVNFIVDRGIKAVFVESSVPAKSLEAVVEGCRKRGHEVSIGGTLYSDAMGAEGTPEGTYIGMVKKNVETIKQALM
ncbi:MAG: metal ABC transporter solute-binding protein, Zn/Mn family [Cyclobacteriaceae bacterium]